MIQTDQKKVIVQQIKIKRRIDSKLTIVLEKEKKVIKKVLKIGFCVLKLKVRHNKKLKNHMQNIVQLYFTEDRKGVKMGF